MRDAINVRYPLIGKIRISRASGKLNRLEPAAHRISDGTRRENVKALKKVKMPFRVNVI